MKILHVITGLQKAAGTSVFVAELATELAVNENDVTIAVVDPKAADIYELDERVKLIAIDEIWQERYDIVHIHGMWAPILHRASNWAHRNKIPVVWSPHGMLQKWALKNKWWKKLAALAIYQWRDLSKAALLHATAPNEVEDIKRLRLTNSIVSASLGARIVTDGLEKKNTEKNSKTLLFVSRVQKKKGLPVLVEAWSKLPDSVKEGWKVRIIGPDQDNHIAELKRQCEHLGVIDDFVFAGPKYGEDLDREYRAADLFVLPTHSENFGSVVIESLAREVPVICSQGAPWKDLLDYRCGWWPKDSVDALKDALVDAMQCSDEELGSMGKRGRKLVEEKYTWDAVCKAMVRGYESIAEYQEKGE